MTTTKRKKSGLFISFEGGEGSGKTTQIGHLVSWLNVEKLKVMVTRQPGGTAIGAKLREIVLDPRHRALSPRAELLLYEADRAQHVDEALRPALDRGTILVSDRFADSSTVYQGICRKLGVDWVIKLNDFATGDLNPDLVILLDVSEKAARARIKKRGSLDRIERETSEFHRKVRRGFLTLAKRFPKRFVVLNGELCEQALASDIQAIVRERLTRRGIWKTT